MSEDAEEYNTERERLLAENRKLRRQIKSLQDMENATLHDGKMKIVGRRAKEFEAYLVELNDKIKLVQESRNIH